MDSIIKINSQTNGREKLIRLAYFSCILSRNFIEGDESSKSKIKKIQKLEEILDLSRKILHFGRTIDVFNSTLNSLIIKDNVLQLTISLSRISSAIYLLIDHIVLLKRLNLMHNKTEYYYVNLGQRFLLFALTMNLARDLYEINNFINSYKSKKYYVLKKNYAHKSQEREIELTWVEYYNLFKVNKHITIDTIKNLFDFLICFSSIQKSNQKYNSKLISFLGITSSLLGLLPIIKYAYRLSP